MECTDRLGGNPISFPNVKLSVDEDHVGSGGDTYSNNNNYNTSITT